MGKVLVQNRSNDDMYKCGAKLRERPSKASWKLSAFRESVGSSNHIVTPKHPYCRLGTEKITKIGKRQFLIHSWAAGSTERGEMPFEGGKEAEPFFASKYLV